MPMSLEMAGALLEGGQRGRPPLTVLYDERCPLCQRLKAWLGGQATLSPVEFVPAASEVARRRFPTLDHERTITVLTVIGPGGAVYEGERAWLVCGWALPAWQPVVERLGGRVHIPLVWIVSRSVDAYRHRLIARPGGQTYGQPCVSDCRVSARP